MDSWMVRLCQRERRKMLHPTSLHKSKLLGVAFWLLPCSEAMNVPRAFTVLEMVIEKAQNSQKLVMPKLSFANLNCTFPATLSFCCFY